MQNIDHLKIPYSLNLDQAWSSLQEEKCLLNEQDHFWSILCNWIIRLWGLINDKTHLDEEKRIKISYKRLLYHYIFPIFPHLPNTLPCGI